jgi:hypothetical protein
MKRIVVKLSGIPFDPTYEIDNDTIAIGDLVRVPSSDSAFIEEGETGIVVALEALIPDYASASPGPFEMVTTGRQASARPMR